VVIYFLRTKHPSNVRTGLSMDSATMPRFEAMTTGGLLDRAFRLYGANFSLILGITAAAYVPLYGVMLLMKAGGVGSPGRGIAALVSEAVFIILWAGLALPIATGAGTYAISERYLGNDVTIGQALSRVLKSLWTLSVAQLAAALWVFIGFVLLVVPGILWSLSYSLVVPAVLIEDQKAAAGLRRSWELVKGNRGKVFAVLVVVSALQWLLGFGVGNLSKLVLDVESSSGSFLRSALKDVTTIFLTPLGIIADILLYYDFRIRKEGFDLEMLSRAFELSSHSAEAQPIPHF
jgi:hypothetical protein